MWSLISYKLYFGMVLRGNDTCPHCRQPASADNLLQLYLTSLEESDIHLKKNCPAQKLEDDLKLKESSLETLKINLENICHENQESRLKLISVEDHNKKKFDKLNEEKNELEFKLNSALFENDKKDNKIKEFEEKINLVEETLFSANLELEEIKNKFFSANNKIERLKYIQDALILQNINNNKGNIFNKCIICKELIQELIQNIEKSLPCSNDQNNIGDEGKMELKNANENKNNNKICQICRTVEHNLTIADGT